MTAVHDAALDAVVAPLLSLFAEAAERADRERRLPQDVVTAARDAGLFRLLVPKAFGGWEVDLVSYLALLEDIGAACGSVAWCIAVSAGSVHALAVQFAPEQARAALEAIGRGAILTGTLPPLGTAVPRDGGYIITGRWPFASLTEHADWRMVGVAAPGPPPFIVDRRVAPDQHLRYCLLPPGTPGVTLHDTWHVLSMQGSGSCDVEVRDVLVPEERTAAVTWNRHRDDMVGVLRVPFSVTQGMSLAAIACGIGRAALDAAIARAREARRPRAPGGDVPLQLALAEASVELAAGRALLARETEAAWERARQEAPITADERTPWWIAAHGAAGLAVRAVDRIFAHAGAHALYDSAPLQRYFRDVRVPLHHTHLHPGETAQEIGRALVGLPPERHNW